MKSTVFASNPSLGVDDARISRFVLSRSAGTGLAQDFSPTRLSELRNGHTSASLPGSITLTHRVLCPKDCAIGDCTIKILVGNRREWTLHPITSLTPPPHPLLTYPFSPPSPHFRHSYCTPHSATVGYVAPAATATECILPFAALTTS